MTALAPPRTPNTEHLNTRIRSSWSGEHPWCQLCGRTDRHHVRWGLCYFCADRNVEYALEDLAFAIRWEHGARRTTPRKGRKENMSTALEQLNAVIDEIIEIDLEGLITTIQSRKATIDDLNAQLTDEKAKETADQETIDRLNTELAAAQDPDGQLTDLATKLAAAHAHAQSALGNAPPPPAPDPAPVGG